MQHRSSVSKAEYEHGETRDYFGGERFAAQGKTPTVQDVLYDIGLAFAGFLTVALLAQFVVTAIPPG